MVPKIEKADLGSKYADKLVVFATELRKNKCRLEKKIEGNHVLYTQKTPPNLCES